MHLNAEATTTHVHMGVNSTSSDQSVLPCVQSESARRMSHLELDRLASTNCQAGAQLQVCRYDHTSRRGRSRDKKRSPIFEASRALLPSITFPSNIPSRDFHANHWWIGSSSPTSSILKLQSYFYKQHLALQPPQDINALHTQGIDNNTTTRVGSET